MILIHAVSFMKIPGMTPGIFAPHTSWKLHADFDDEQNDTLQTLKLVLFCVYNG